MRKIVLAALLVAALTTAVAAQEVKVGLSADVGSDIRVGQLSETGNSFEIEGTVSSVNDSSFMVMGELVAVTQEDMGRLKANDILKAGNLVEVKGEIKNNIMIANEVNLLEKNFQTTSSEQGQAEVKGEANGEADYKGLLENIISTIRELFSN